MGPEETSAYWIEAGKKYQHQLDKMIKFAHHYGVGPSKLNTLAAQKQAEYYAQALAKTQEVLGMSADDLAKEESEETPVTNQNFGSTSVYVNNVNMSQYVSNASFSFKDTADEFTKMGESVKKTLDTMSKTWTISTTYNNVNTALMDTLLGTPAAKQPLMKPDVRWRDDEDEGLAIYHVGGDLTEAIMQEVIDLIHDTWVNSPDPEFAEERALFQKWARYATLTTPVKRWTTMQDWSDNADGCDLYKIEPLHVPVKQIVPVLYWPEPK